jgi:hypothetical protein
MNIPAANPSMNLNRSIQKAPVAIKRRRPEIADNAIPERIRSTGSTRSAIRPAGRVAIKAPIKYAEYIAPCIAAPLTIKGKTGTIALESAITVKAQKQRGMRALISDHAVCFEIHRGVRLNVVTLVNGTCKVNGVVFIPMNAEDLLGFGLDLPDIVHQLPAIRVP